MADEISVVQSPKQMAIGEVIAWTFDFSDIGTPSSVTSFLAYDATYTDKSSTVLSGSTSIAGDVVTGKLFTPASEQDYTLQCKVVISGNTVIATLLVECYNPIAAITLSNGYTTLKELRRYMFPQGSTDQIDDIVLASLVEAASRYLDQATERTFYARAETRYFSVPGKDAYENPRWLWLDDDLLTVTTLTNGDTTVLTTADYYLWPRNLTQKCAIVLKESSAYYWQQDSNSNTEYVISVAGTWGYSATTPDDINQATLDIASSLYKRRFGENFTATSTITAAGLVVTPRDLTEYTRMIIDRYRRLL